MELYSIIFISFLVVVSLFFLFKEYQRRTKQSLVFKKINDLINNNEFKLNSFPSSLKNILAETDISETIFIERKEKSEWILCQIINKTLTKESISQDELSDLGEISKILNVSESSFNKELNSVIKLNLENSMIEFIDNPASEIVDDIKNRYLLTKQQFEDLFAKPALEIFLRLMMNDKRISDEEEKAYENVAELLGVNVSLEYKTKELFQKYKRYWELENNELEAIEQNDFILNSKEKIYYIGKADWFEERKVTKKVNYSGPSYKIKITKNFSYRVGSISAQRITEDQLTHIDSGVFAITNKNILFKGNRGIKKISFSSIYDINQYSNGFKIGKSTGKDVTLEIDYEADIAYLILNRKILDFNE